MERLGSLSHRKIDGKIRKSFSSQNSLSQTLHGKYFWFFYLSKLPKGLKNDSLLKDLLKTACEVIKYKILIVLNSILFSLAEDRDFLTLLESF